MSLVPGHAAETASRLLVEPTVKQQPNRDVHTADDGQQTHHQASGFDQPGKLVAPAIPRHELLRP